MSDLWINRFTKCDQIWRNFKPFVIFVGLFSIWQNVEPTLTKVLCLLRKTFNVFGMAKYWTINLVTLAGLPLPLPLPTNNHRQCESSLLLLLLPVTFWAFHFVSTFLSDSFLPNPRDAESNISEIFDSECFGCAFAHFQPTFVVSLPTWRTDRDDATRLESTRHAPKKPPNVGREEWEGEEAHFGGIQPSTRWWKKRHFVRWRKILFRRLRSVVVVVARMTFKDVSNLLLLAFGS